MNKSESISNLAAALAKFQAEVVSPKNNADNPYFSSKYAPLHEVINVIREPLSKNGLSYIQSTLTEGQNVIITTLLMHESGEYIESDPLSLPGLQSLKGGSKDFTPQGIGSAITYGRRYSLTAILGIASEDDTDGNEGTPDPRQEENGTSNPNGKTAATGAITPTIRAKYKAVFGKEDGVEAFVAKHRKNAESELTKLMQAKAGGAGNAK